ncbi:hypothetical protein ACQKII_18090 [Lysinibacillus sp. NPDC048646]|uniref:hypothetical protein n=1 Tax=Lysinibacillus sp. NPDC048646 TaxID=3390574 RepID=UPI003D067255
MFYKFMIFNIKLSPAYIILALALIFEIVLFGREIYVSDIVIAIAQIEFLLSIPNIVYMIRHRKESGSFLAFLGMILIIPQPYILIAIALWILYI